MAARRAMSPLLALTLLISSSACVAESGKTDTLVIQPAATQAPAPRPAQPPADTQAKVDTVIAGSGTINLRNPNFTNVNVEVRVGPNADCAQNAEFGTRQLQRGATWTISANQDVCWRRDVNPDAPNGMWTPWNRQAITPNSTHEATL